MSETSVKSNDDPFKDHLVVTHPDGNSEKLDTPETDGPKLKVGRELDNDIVLTDPRASRYHAEIRRAGNVLEVKDLTSANGVLINGERIEPETWTKITPRQTLTMAETRLVWEKSMSSQSTVVMSRVRRDETKASAVPPRATQPEKATPAAEKKKTPMLTWILAAGAVVALLVFVVVLLVMSLGGGSDSTTGTDGTRAAVQASPATGRGTDENLNQQSTSVEPTSTPTPSGPQLAIPLVELSKLQVSPIIFGASPNTKNAYLYIDVRTRNAGNIPFIFSISNFSLKDRKSGQIFTEAGANTSENYLKQLGAIDRFENLALTPGGSVPGSLVFELEIGTYDLELVFDAADISPLVLGMGNVNMRRELDLAAGTPMAALGSEADVAPTATVEPTPTATRPAAIPAPRVVARSALAGTIAYPVFNGETYDIYFGDVSSTESIFFRSQASQPAFNADGSRIAFHSWDNSSRGLITMDVSGANGNLAANSIEDQLPTWATDSNDIILLSRRSGDRKSHLVKVDSNTERSEGTILGEGEYPTVGPTGNIVFKGWGNTAFGLRLASSNLGDVETVSNVETDTAPSLSPDGSKVVFMSRREDNWDIYVVNINGSNLQRLTSDPAQDGLPVWSPNGNAIAFLSDRGGIWAVWVMTPDGKGISQLFTLPGSPDGFVGSDTYASRGWAEERISWTSEVLVIK